MGKWLRFARNFFSKCVFYVLKNPVITQNQDNRSNLYLFLIYTKIDQRTRNGFKNFILRHHITKVLNQSSTIYQVQLK